MIGQLKGIIDHIDTAHIILDVGGIGYIVHASSRTLSRIGGKGDAVKLLIDMQIREDSMTLYGFADAMEQEWFRLLTSVQGVGAKVGLAILSACPPERLALTIAAEDKAAIRAADGVGPKLAVRILTELKDKAAKMALSAGMAAPKTAQANASHATPANNDITNDAVSALENLGYARGDAYTAVLNAQSEANDNLQTLIRLALKALGTKNY